MCFAGIRFLIRLGLNASAEPVARAALPSLIETATRFHDE